jgi:hypothetical protein
VLDGGLKKWIEEGKSTTGDIIKIIPSNYTVSEKKELVKNISFLEVSTVSDGDLYLLINEDITLSLLDKYFFAVFQYFGFLLMSSCGWYFFLMINFSSKNN